jgi:hypothetical protein
VFRELDELLIGAPLVLEDVHRVPEINSHSKKKDSNLFIMSRLVAPYTRECSGVREVDLEFCGRKEKKQEYSGRNEKYQKCYRVQ